MEERLLKMISGLRTLQLNVSLEDQTFTVTKRSLRVFKEGKEGKESKEGKEGDYCNKEKAKQKNLKKRQGTVRWDSNRQLNNPSPYF